MARKHVIVLMGGASSEHEVSLASGANVIEGLRSARRRVTPVTITKDGLWIFPGADPVTIHEAIARLRSMEVDCVFIALHGAFGEDGRIQGLLDLLDLPYTSSGCAASALAIDKIRSKAVVRDAGVRVAKHLAVVRAAWDAAPDKVLSQIAGEIGIPCVVKSPCQGSSVGMAIPKTHEELREAIPFVFTYDDVLMAEQFVRGTEVTCGVLDVDPAKGAVPLPVTEIRPVTSSYFDYHAKYTPGASTEITPAEISPELTAEVQRIAVHAHNLVGCSIWTRNDMIIDQDGPVWIEINTVPGMTGTSLYPQAAAAAGISYPELMDLFVQAAIARHDRSKKGN